MNKTEHTPVRVILVVVGLLAVALGPAVAEAQTDVLYVTNNNVGIRTSSPFFPLDVAGAARTTGFYVGANAGYYILDFLGDNLGVTTQVARFGMSAYSNGFTVSYKPSPQSMVYSFIDGNVGIGTGAPAYPLHFASGAFVSVGGVFTNASSREYKQDIQDLSTEAASEALEKLTPVTYAYKAAPQEQHVGFIAEDVPDLVATPDRKGLSPMDVVAVLTKVVQDQQETIRQMSERLARVEAGKK